MTPRQAPYSAIVIGCGFIGSQFNETPTYDPRHTHAASYAEHPRTRFAAVCDTSAERSAAAAKHWDVDAYTDIWEILDKTNPEIVSIASSTETHAEILNTVLQHPSVKAILCEKPITKDVQESQNLVEDARAKNIILSVNYSRRFNKGFQKAKQMIEKDELGNIRIATSIYQKGILNNGSHFIDLFRFLMGEIISVQAEPDPDATYDSDLSGRLIFENGLSAYIHGGSSVGDSFADIDLIGTKARIRTEQCGHVILKYDLEPSPLFPGYTDFGIAKNISGGLIDFTYNAINDIIECLDGTKIRPSCTGEDAVCALAIVDALVLSARTGTMIEVK
ncbi:MAG: Gfo/Idh/MocA family oxidoreductase [Rhodospirillales bacterium]|nr:Gfo/Idh/MocA family oxidoreductase [Rhodospirillales bacterium]